MRTTVACIAHQLVGNGEAHDLEGGGIGEAGIDIAHGQEGADHEHRADEQNQRHGDLGDDQQIAGALAFAADAGCPRGAEQGLALPRRSIAQYRDGAEEQAGKHRENEGEGDGPAVEGNLAETRQFRGANRRQQAQPGVGYGHAGSSAEQAQRDALQQQLARDAPSAGTERGADGKLLLASIGADQQQVGDVGAGDQHHQADRGHDHPEHGVDAADDGVFQGLQGRRDLPLVDTSADRCPERSSTSPSRR